MLEKLKPLLVATLIFSLTNIFLVNNTKASDQTITCNDSGCSGIAGPLFDENNLAPSANVIQTLTASNNYPQDRNFLIQVDSPTFSDSIPSMGDAITLEITEQESSSIVYGPKTLTELNDDGEVTLSNIPAGSQRNYDFSATFNNVGNEYQGMVLTFNFRFGFEEISEDSGNSSSSSNSSSESDGGGEVLGATTENLVGNVLGLSATGSGIINIIIWIIGVLLGVLGSLLIVNSLIRRRKFMVRRISFRDQ